MNIIVFPILCARAQQMSSRQLGPVPMVGQIIVDPNNASYLVYNRDRNKDGKLDPFFLIGPGDPEGLLYLGGRQPDGTRKGGKQLHIINRIKENGGNGIYFQVVRSHGGDGKSNHNPWQNPNDPSSGLDPDIIRQWKGWFDQMQEAGIAMFLFIYDDGARPFGDGCTGTVGNAEQAFIQDLVNALEAYPNLIWVIQEEFKFVGQGSDRRPCDAARISKIGKLADLVKRYDDYNHPVGVHHNKGEPMDFPNHPSVDIYVQQASVTVDEGRGNLHTLHAAGQPGNGFDPERRYNYTMAEAHDWSHALMDELDRAMLRKSYYATAMAGGYVMVLGMFGAEGPPTDEMLQDMRRMQTFFESTNFNEMVPNDALGYGDTRWVLADPEKGSCYILYTYDSENGSSLGVRGLWRGSYTLRWFDPVTGDSYVQRNVRASGNALFEKPEEIGSEVLLYLTIEE